MKKFIKLLPIFWLTLSTTLLFSQVRVVNGTTNSVITSGSAFIDASSNTTINSSTNVGKGLIFPSTDLTNFTSFNVTGPLGATTNYPTYFDGMIVYNTATGISSIGSVDVVPGYYYYNNPGQTFPSGTATSGVWTPLGGGASSAVAIADGVASDSYATINATQEKVVRLTGIAADGVNTTLDLDAALTTASVTIAKFRKAAIYNAAGDLVMHATGGYTTGTDILVTGNGMMNKLLPAGNYSVEVYYIE
jgi:hypothetical protein|tara:strand:- start:513 stop:1256 length:744 start_codon:yes stop_codon:yes gene_type:complete